MAASLTKSPNRNPNSRSSEINTPTRRSFSGNPFSKPSVVTKPKGFSVTPANSPSDFPRRNSISRENIPHLPRNHGDKENGKEQPARIRSPSPFKGSKNFMSPTISAASKVTAPSPKKKILAEKNEFVLRTSFSSSDGKASFNSVSFSGGLDHVSAPPEKKLAGFKAPWVSSTSVVDHKVVPSTPKNDSKLRPETHALVEDVHDLDLSSIGSTPNGSLATLAPLDADPLMPPYDAEANFTSPRPQFLCYRPNPQIRERQGQVLEDSFVSDSSSGAQLIEETETQSEVSSEEMVQEEMLHLSEPNPSSAHMSKGSKLQFFRRPKTIAFLLTILVACLSVTVTDSPVVGLVLKDPSHANYFYVPSEFTEYAKAQWDGLAQNFGIWYAKSVAYLCELVFNLRAHKLGPMKYSNLTSLYDDQYLVDGYLAPDSVMVWEEKKVVETDLLDEVHQEIEEYGNGGEASGHEKVEVEVQDITEDVQEDCDSPTSELHLDDIEVVAEHDGSESTVHDNIEVVAEELNLTPEAEAPRTSSPEVDGIQEDNVLAAQIATSGAEESESSERHASTESLRRVDFNWLSDRVLNVNVLGICLLALLAAATAFCARKGNTPAGPAASIYSTIDQPAKKFDISPKSACASVDERLVSQSWATEVDLVGESCPTEMSSFQTSSSYSKKAPKDSSEAQSEERKPRKNYGRESLASSDYSVGSMSTYGSFTTYEKISAKHANGGEVTPVRRSSRIIRKQVTSP